MANKLSFTAAVSTLIDKLNKITGSVKTVLKAIETDVPDFAKFLWTVIRRIHKRRY